MKSKIINTFFILCWIGLIFSMVWGIRYNFISEILGLIKATTAIQVFGFICAAHIIQSIKPQLKKMNSEWINLLIIIIFVLLLLSIFEVFFAFNYWFSKAVITGTLNNLDATCYTPQEGVFSTGEITETSINLMAKIYLSCFFIFLYLFYIINDVKRELMKSNKDKN